MIKITSNNDYDFACDSVQLLRDVSSDLIKRAGCRELLKFAKTPNQEDLHIIAVGAYEGTGCFFKGAPVQTIEGITPIEKIKVGDLVLTHKGRYRKVTAIFQEEYAGEQVALDIIGMCDPIISTSNHPFSILKACEFKSKHRCPSLLDPTDDPTAILDDILENKLQFVSAKNIEACDYAVTPINISLEEPVTKYTEDEAYLFGYYLSEGCLVKEYKTCATKGEYKQLLFTINTQGDKPIVDFLRKFIENQDREFSPQKSYTSDIGLRIPFGHKEYAKTVLNLFGAQSTTKHISPKIFVQPLDWKFKFLAAYFDGDGSLIQDNTNGESRYIGTLTASTASRNLAYDLQRLLASCGITSSIYQGVNKISNGCFGNSDHVIYQVSIDLSHSGKILEYCKRLEPIEKTSKHIVGRSWTSSNYLILKIKSVTKSAVQTIKYNLEVAEDNTYVVDILGHNSNRNGDFFREKDCIKNHHYFTDSNRAVHRHHKNKPTDPKFGNIKAAAYNKRMKRIELIVGLDKDKCQDILHEQETTGNTNWSMASKQAHDICTFCGHKAKSDKDRCEHIPRQLGEINKFGVACAMENPDPRWFEISHVRRPADRIGMSLGKMASLNGVLRPINQDEYLLLKESLYIPEDVLISKKACDKRELLHKLASIEKHIDMVAHSSKPTNSKDSYIKEHAHKINKSSKIDAPSMDKLRSMDPSMVLKTLADHGIVFSPEDFSKYLFNNRLDHKHMEGMKTHLPTTFRDHEDSGEVINSEKFEPDHVGKVNPELKNLAGKLHEGHSLESGPAVRRIMIICMGGGMIPHSPEEKTKEAADHELAKQYTAYKLAALNYMNEQGKLDDEVLLNAVLQNQ